MKKIRNIVIVIFLFPGMGLLNGCYFQKFKELTHGGVPKHNNWDRLLQKHVTNTGDVDYVAFSKDSELLDSYLNLLGKNPPAKNWTKNEKLAYYINLYNAGTLKLILENYPVKSIKDISSPWSKKRVKIGTRKFSLGSLEHSILRKMNEPRIHFAINCASYSCPKLLNRAFMASKMEQQLEQATKDFILDLKRNNVSSQKAELSEIFKWYKNDFTVNGTLLEYIDQYTPQKISNNTEIKYIDYNWSLNEAK